MVTNNALEYHTPHVSIIAIMPAGCRLWLVRDRRLPEKMVWPLLLGSRVLISIHFVLIHQVPFARREFAHLLAWSLGFFLVLETKKFKRIV